MLLKDLWMLLLYILQNAPPWYESGRIVLSTILGLVTMLMAALIAYREFKSKATERWENNYNAEKTSREIAEGEAKRLAAELAQREAEYSATLHEKDIALKDCERRTDLDALMRQHKEFQTEVVGIMTKMVTANDGRSDRLLRLMEEQSAHQSLMDTRILQVLDGLTQTVAALMTTVEVIRERLSEK